jgi:rod shape-determining protein MreC
LHETIIINKGKNDGIKKGDPLIKNNILVGKILKTNFNTSHGILITNLNSRIPVRIGKNNYKAVVVGNPKSERLLNLEFLPKEFTFEDGDYIYTASIENIMPEGILVGQIKLLKDDDFEARPLYDFGQLDYLTVVKFGK